MISSNIRLRLRSSFTLIQDHDWKVKYLLCFFLTVFVYETCCRLPWNECSYWKDSVKWCKFRKQNQISTVQQSGIHLLSFHSCVDSSSQRWHCPYSRVWSWYELCISNPTSNFATNLTHHWELKPSVISHVSSKLNNSLAPFSCPYSELWSEKPTYRCQLYGMMSSEVLNKWASLPLQTWRIGKLVVNFVTWVGTSFVQECIVPDH